MKLIWSGSVAIDILRRIISQAPKPEVQTKIAQRCAETIGLHLIMLILTVSDANLRGRHSCALALFRAMEDALDCFASVSLIPGTAEKWAKGKLSASDAARFWEDKISDRVLPTGEKAIEYRKTIRNKFNNFAHCTPYLTDWNIYPEFNSDMMPKSGGELTAQFRINHEERILEQNAIRIGAYLAAHTLEFIQVIEKAYERYLTENPNLKRELINSRDELENELKTEFGAVNLEDMPPELKEPVIKDPNNPSLVMQLTFQYKNPKDDATANNSE
jgi:hypothetical protein